MTICAICQLSSFSLFFSKSFNSLQNQEKRIRINWSGKSRFPFPRCAVFCHSIRVCFPSRKKGKEFQTTGISRRRTEAKNYRVSKSCQPRPKKVSHITKYFLDFSGTQKPVLRLFSTERRRVGSLQAFSPRKCGACSSS